MNTRTFVKTTAAGLLGSVAPIAFSAGESIYDSVKAPPELARSFIWWACQACPNLQYVMRECVSSFNGEILIVPEPVFGVRHLSQKAQDRITAECDAFWALAKSVIRSAKGRCNWSPLVDTDENHVGNCGTNFHSVRHGSEFFVKTWPSAERAEFCKHARSFAPMFLEECEGLLEYREGRPPLRLSTPTAQNAT